MPDLDQRVVDGLRELTDRAPIDADVWPAAERYVVKHRRRRRAMASGVMVIALGAGGIAAIGLTRGASSKAVVTDPGPSGNTSSPLAATGPVNGSFKITAGVTGGLTFDPDSITVPTGVYAVTLADGANAQHTLGFDDPATLFSLLTVSNLGDTNTARVFFGRPGDYTFFCAVPGHRAAGMHGVVHVTGSPVSLAQAEAAAAKR